MGQLIVCPMKACYDGSLHFLLGISMALLEHCLHFVSLIANRVFVRTKLLPDDPVSTFNLDPNLPTFYVARLNSFSDRAALDFICKQLKLPLASGLHQFGTTDIPRFIALQNPPPLFSSKIKQTNALAIGEAIFSELSGKSKRQAQIIPVTILWGRHPGKEKPGIHTLLSHSLAPSWLRKCFVLLFSGRDNLVRFSRPIDIEALRDGKSKVNELPHKLLRVARVHFRRQKLAATGPKLPSRDKLFRSLLAAPSIKKAISDEAKLKNVPYKQVKHEAQELLDEIAANYSDATIKVAERVLTWLWNKLYNGIEINYAQRVHELADKGHEIIYVPCHRSHMDYLLLTYVIYHQGLVPPHIAAGINLNFFPAGGIFRRSGAFFIRRSFTGNKLYSAVFKEYLSQLFIQGYPVKFYTEGGRSRTGRLLPPKTGMLAMTLQSMLRGIERPVSIVPVYIGYEHVMEINTYLKELAGKSKKNESLFAVFKAIKNLKNYGRGYLNFGEPININQYLNTHQKDWRESINATDIQKPLWLNQQVANLADTIMMNINCAAALNAINLLATILLSQKQCALSKSKLLKQIEFYIGLQTHAHYHELVTVPEQNSVQLLQHALKLNKFDVLDDPLGDIIAIKESERTLFNYYKNNIVHLFAVPSVIALLLINKRIVTRRQCYDYLQVLYPLFAKEWFLTPLTNTYADQVVTYFSEQRLLTVDEEKLVTSQASHCLFQLETLGNTLQLTLQRYAIVVSVLMGEHDLSRKNLEEMVDNLANRLGKLQGVKSPEFFDKKVLSTFISNLTSQEYIKVTDNGLIKSTDKAVQLSSILNTLVPAGVWQSINDNQ